MALPLDQVAGTQAVDQLAAVQIVVNQVAGAEVVGQVAGIRVVMNLVAGTQLHEDLVPGAMKMAVVILV